MKTVHNTQMKHPQYCASKRRALRSEMMRHRFENSTALNDRKFWVLCPKLIS